MWLCREIREAFSRVWQARVQSIVADLELSSLVVFRNSGFRGQQLSQPCKAEAAVTYQHFERIYARGKEAPEISALLTMMII